MNKGALFLIAFLNLFACKNDEAPDIHFVDRIIYDLIEPVNLFNTKIQGYWVDAPNIRICPDANIARERVQTALSTWERYGYRFGRIIMHVENGYPCEAQTGEIAFRLPTQEEISHAVQNSQLGVTKTQIHTPTKQIIASDIYFQTRVASHSSKIVEHELGHALGWEHHNRRGHIMNPRLDETGYSFIGVERSRYDQRIDELRQAIENNE